MLEETFLSAAEFEVDPDRRSLQPSMDDVRLAGRECMGPAAGRPSEMAFRRALRACQTTPGVCQTTPGVYQTTPGDWVVVSGSGSITDVPCLPSSRRRLN